MAMKLVSSVPGIWQAAMSLLTTQGAAQSPAVKVFPFELGQYEPGSYVLLHEAKNLKLLPEDPYSLRESYDIAGYVTYWTGTGISGADYSGVTLSVLQQTYDIFTNVVTEALISNRTLPLWGTTGPTPFQFFFTKGEYVGAPGHTQDGAPWGWEGRLDFSIHVDALLPYQNA